MRKKFLIFCTAVFWFINVAAAVKNGKIRKYLMKKLKNPSKSAPTISLEVKKIGKNYEK